MACVVGDEELATGRAGVAFSLVVVPDVDLDVFSLALDHEHRRPVRGLGLRRFPDHGVGARAPVAVRGPPLLGDLFERVAVVVAEVANEMLAHGFFRLPRHVPPFLAQGNPEPVAFPVQDFGCRRKRRRGRRPGFGRCLGLPSAGRLCYSPFLLSSGASARLPRAAVRFESFASDVPEPSVPSSSDAIPRIPRHPDRPRAPDGDSTPSSASIFAIT